MDLEEGSKTDEGDEAGTGELGSAGGDGLLALDGRRGGDTAGGAGSTSGVGRRLNVRRLTALGGLGSGLGAATVADDLRGGGAGLLDGAAGRAVDGDGGGRGDGDHLITVGDGGGLRAVGGVLRDDLSGCVHLLVVALRLAGVACVLLGRQTYCTGAPQPPRW